MVGKMQSAALKGMYTKQPKPADKGMICILFRLG